MRITLWAILIPILLAIAACTANFYVTVSPEGMKVLKAPATQPAEAPK